MNKTAILATAFIIPFLIPLKSNAQSASSGLNTPNVSANMLLLGRHSTFGRETTSTNANGIDIQEAELAFYSDVDPYSRLSLLLSIHPEYSVNDTSDGVNSSWILEPEEAYVESTVLPSSLLKAGKFKTAFGKHNTLHTHAFPFIEAPLTNSQLLGNEGLSDVGISLAIMVPMNWFSEVTAQFIRGKGENDEFNTQAPGDGVGVAHWKNLWELNDSLTLEVGASYARGKNSNRGTTQLSGADLTFKWRPTAGGKYHSAIVAAELIQRQTDNPAQPLQRDIGWNIWGQYQFMERWAALVRFDQIALGRSETTDDFITTKNANRYTTGLVFNATEFSSLRLEYNYTDGRRLSTTNEKIDQAILLQGSFTIGAHPSHSY